MKIRNNTKSKVVIYAGDTDREEPEFVKELKVGEECEVPELMAWYISIQDI